MTCFAAGAGYPLLERFKIQYEIANLIHLKPKFRHVLMARHNPFGLRLRQLHDRIFVVQDAKRPGNLQRAFAYLVNGMATRAVGASVVQSVARFGANAQNSKNGANTGPFPGSGVVFRHRLDHRHRSPLGTQFRLLASRMFGSAHHERRNLGMRQHFVYLAAQQNAVDPATSVRCHDDQIALLLICNCNDTLGRILIWHMNDFARHVIGNRLLGRSVEYGSGGGRRKFFKMPNGIGLSHSGFMGQFHG